MTEDRTMSLNAVLELIETCNSSGLTGIFCSYDDGKRFADMIKKLPPVTSNDEEMAMQYQRGFIDGFKEGKATFEPKTGHWIFDEILDRHYYCSECKSMGVDYWDYCPNCGAKMVEAKERSE